MTDEPTQPMGRALEKVETMLSRVLHYAPAGSPFTLCGRAALYPVRWGWHKPPCPRCTREATNHGWRIPG